MSTRSKSAPRTVGEALEEFLDAERLRLSPSTLARYRSVVTLFRIFLENSEVHAAPGLSADVEMTPVLAQEFINRFLGTKISRSETTRRASSTVMRRLLRWLNDRLLDQHDPDEIVDKTSTEVTAAVNLHKLLSQHLGEQGTVHTVRRRTDHFTVTRVESGVLWLESHSGGDAIGPVTVPLTVSQLCRVGWDLTGVVARSFGGWRLLEIWNVST